MKLTQGVLEGTTAQPKPTPPVSTGKKLERTLHKNEVSLQSKDPVEVYPPAVAEYAAKFGYELAEHQDEAFRRRAAGEKVLTHREADNAARARIDLNDTMIRKALLSFHGLIIEGLPSDPDSVWEVRAYYNRGVEFKKSGNYNRVSLEKQKKADEKMAELLQKLDDNYAPAWPHEVTGGFPVELTKPEWMTWGQYNQLKQTPIRIIDPDAEIQKTLFQG